MLYPGNEILKAIENMEKQSRKIMISNSAKGWNMREMSLQQIHGCWNLAADLQLIDDKTWTQKLKDSTDFADKCEKKSQETPTAPAMGMAGAREISN